MAIVETESLPACIIFALVSGILLTLSTACTAYPAYIDRKVEEDKDKDNNEPTDHEDVENTSHSPDNRNSPAARTPSVVDVKDSISLCSSVLVISHREEYFEDDVGALENADMTIEEDNSKSNKGNKNKNYSSNDDDDNDDDDVDDDNNNSKIPKENKKNVEGKVSSKMWIVAYAGNLIFAIIGGTATLVGSWFGPVSIFSPIKQVSQILSGMIMYSFILKTEEKPSKETSVGNFIIAVSTILLIFVGAEVRTEPIDIEELFDNDFSIFYGAVLLFLAIVVTFPYQFILGFTKLACLTDRVNFVFLLLTEVVHAVVATSASKMIPLLEGRWTWFSLDIVLMVITILTSAYSAFLRSTVILSQTTYMPLMLSTNVILNGMTGLIVWNDQIQNVGGYVCTYLFFILGVYLITDYELRLNKQGEISFVRRAILETTILHERAAELLEERSIRQRNYHTPAISVRSAENDSFMGKRLHFIEEESGSLPDETGKKECNESSTSSWLPWLGKI